MYCIYRITNKINNKTYIGQHKYKDLSMDEYMGSGKYLWNAYTKYGIENFEKEILISEVKTKEEINKLEIKYIRLERESGHGEYNIKDGGSGGWLMNNEIKRKISESHKKENLSKETRRKLSESHKKENLSIETRRRLSESQIGKHPSEETRKKLSEAHKGRRMSEYNKRRLLEANLGKHPSEEVRKRMSESHKGKYLSEERKRKMSEFRSGKSFYNNGIECHLFMPGTEPEGYISGKLPKIKES